MDIPRVGQPAGLAMLTGYPSAAIVLAALWVLDFARRVITVRR